MRTIHGRILCAIRHAAYYSAWEAQELLNRQWYSYAAPAITTRMPRCGLFDHPGTNIPSRYMMRGWTTWGTGFQTDFDYECWRIGVQECVYCCALFCSKPMKAQTMSHKQTLLYLRFSGRACRSSNVTCLLRGEHRAMTVSCVLVTCLAVAFHEMQNDDRTQHNSNTRLGDLAVPVKLSQYRQRCINV